MNSYERCLAAIQFQDVDRMPTDLHNFLMCAEESGMDFGEFVLDDSIMARMQISMWEEFGHDMLLVENGTAALGAGPWLRRDLQEKRGTGGAYHSNKASGRCEESGDAG